VCQDVPINKNEGTSPVNRSTCCNAKIATDQDGTFCSNCMNNINPDGSTVTNKKGKTMPAKTAPAAAKTTAASKVAKVAATSRPNPPEKKPAAKKATAAKTAPKAVATKPTATAKPASKSTTTPAKTDAVLTYAVRMQTTREYLVAFTKDLTYLDSNAKKAKFFTSAARAASWVKRAGETVIEDSPVEVVTFKNGRALPKTTVITVD
jgi:hypothetical protein